MMGQRSWTKLSIALLLLFVVLVVLSPSFHDRYFGVAKNEATAVGSLRKITALESQYAAAHPDAGFACQLPLVRPTEGKISGEYNATEALLAGEWSGYKFAVTGCVAQANGIATHYQVIAVPAKPGSSGIRAFCTDQSGKIFYDPDASASKCLASRQPLP
jgi:hypothetical protein